jgi:hypothetical protein
MKNRLNRQTQLGEALLHFTPDILLAIFLQSLYLLWNLTLQVNLNGQILINFNITYILFLFIVLFDEFDVL